MLIQEVEDSEPLFVSLLDSDDIEIGADELNDMKR